MLKAWLLSLVVLASASLVPGIAHGRDLYVPNQGSGTVSAMDASTGTVKATITVGSGPTGAAASPNGSRLYVTNSSSASVSVIDVATNTVVTTIAVGTTPRGVAVNPAGTRAYVGNSGTQTISVIDTSTNTVTETISGGGGGVALTPDGSRLYVTVGPNLVKVFDTANNQVVNSGITVGTTPQTLVVTPDGSKVYVTNAGSGTVSVIDTSTNTVIATVSLGASPTLPAVTADSSQVYVPHSNASTVSVIGTAANSITETFTVGSSLRGGMINLDGSRFYETGGTANIFVVDTSTKALVNTFTSSGTTPFGVVLAPDQPPVASFTAREAAAGDLTTLNASSSTDPDGSVARYDWNFGDGTTLSSGGATPSHRYEQAGTYTVTLTTTDDEGCSTSLVYNGWTSLCNGGSSARASVQVVVPAGPQSYQPDWRLGVVKDKRGDAAQLRFAVGASNLNLKRATVLISRKVDLHTSALSTCRTPRAKTAEGDCRLSSRIGQIYFTVSGSKVIRRNLYYSGVTKRGLHTFTTGQSDRSQQAGEAAPGLSWIRVTRSGRLTLRIGVKSANFIERVGVVLFGDKSNWITYAGKAGSRICGYAVIRNQDDQRLRQRKCEKVLKSRKG